MADRAFVQISDPAGGVSNQVQVSLLSTSGAGNTYTLAVYVVDGGAGNHPVSVVDNELNSWSPNVTQAESAAAGISISQCYSNGVVGGTIVTVTATLPDVFTWRAYIIEWEGDLPLHEPPPRVENAIGNTTICETPLMPTTSIAEVLLVLNQGSAGSRGLTAAPGWTLHDSDFRHAIHSITYDVTGDYPGEARIDIVHNWAISVMTLAASAAPPPASGLLPMMHAHH